MFDGIFDGGPDATLGGMFDGMSDGMFGGMFDGMRMSNTQVRGQHSDVGKRRQPERERCACVHCIPPDRPEWKSRYDDNQKEARQ